MTMDRYTIQVSIDGGPVHILDRQRPGRHFVIDRCDLIQVIKSLTDTANQIGLKPD